MRIAPEIILKNDERAELSIGRVTEHPGGVVASLRRERSEFMEAGHESPIADWRTGSGASGSPGDQKWYSPTIIGVLAFEPPVPSFEASLPNMFFQYS